jgi:myo-inositol-1(or 4)-monophosphatase
MVMLRYAAKDAGASLQTYLGRCEEMEHQGIGSATIADFTSLEFIATRLFTQEPDIPILTEKRTHDALKGMSAHFPTMKLIEVSDDEEKLPDTFFSIDPLDGTALFVNGCPEFSISIALVHQGKPQAAVMFMPISGTEVSVYTGHGCILNGVKRMRLNEERPLWRCLIGLALGPKVDEITVNHTLYPLMKEFCAVRNMPSVASGIELLLGRTAAWVSTNARIWGVAGTALAVHEANGVAECLDGSPIPWNCVRMPPLLFAANQRIADEVRLIVQK